MPTILGALIGALIQAAGSWVGSAMLALGISAASFVGIASLATSLKAQVFSAFASTGAPDSFVHLLGVLQVGTCVNILFSAYMVRLTLRGLRGDTLRKFVVQ
jgi:hypothetical protein